MSKKTLGIQDIRDDLDVDHLEVLHMINRHGLPAYRFNSKWTIHHEQYEKWKKSDEFKGWRCCYDEASS